MKLSGVMPALVTPFDAKGKIAGVFHARRIKGHAQTVLDAAREHVAAKR